MGVVLDTALVGVVCGDGSGEAVIGAESEGEESCSGCDSSTVTDSSQWEPM